jgi:hypothetical protein
VVSRDEIVETAREGCEARVRKAARGHVRRDWASTQNEAIILAKQHLVVTRQSWHEGNLFLFRKVSRAVLPAIKG